MAADWTPVLVGAGAVLSAFALVLPTIVAVWSHNVQTRKLDGISEATNGMNAALQAKLDISANELAAARSEAPQHHEPHHE